jgi:preprotein translocase subunit SecE
MAKEIALADNNEDGFGRLKSKPREWMEFLQNVRSEMRKVVSPSWPEIRSTTTVVIVTVFVFAGYFAVVDSLFGKGLTQLIQYLTKH